MKSDQPSSVSRPASNRSCPAPRHTTAASPSNVTWLVTRTSRADPASAAIARRGHPPNRSCTFRGASRTGLRSSGSAVSKSCSRPYESSWSTPRRARCWSKRHRSRPARASRDRATGASFRVAHCVKAKRARIAAGPPERARPRSFAKATALASTFAVFPPGSGRYREPTDRA